MGHSSEDEALDAIALSLDHPVRRAVVSLLVDRDAPVIELEELATELSDALDRPVEDLLVALHHAHLPKLDALGAVEFDHRSGDVRYRADSAVGQAVDDGALTWWPTDSGEARESSGE